MKELFNEFKKFAFKGNVIDMAVGVMIGAAFGAIVTSLVNDLFMPILSLLTGRINFADLKIMLGEGETAASINYGAFLQAVINFLLIAVCVFLFVKLISKMQRKPEEAPTTEARKCMFCKMEIADDAIRCPHCTSELSK